MNQPDRLSSLEYEIESLKSQLHQNKDQNSIAEKNWIEQICRENQLLQAQVTQLSNDLRNTRSQLESAKRDLSLGNRGWQMEHAERKKEEKRRAEKMQRAHQAQLAEASRQCSILRNFCEQVQQEKESLRMEIKNLKTKMMEVEHREQAMKAKQESFDKMKSDKEFASEEIALWRQRSFDLHIQMRRNKSPGWDGFSRPLDANQMRDSLYEESYTRAKSVPPRRPSREAPPSPSQTPKTTRSGSLNGETPPVVPKNLYLNGIEAARDRIYQALGDSPKSELRSSKNTASSFSRLQRSASPTGRKLELLKKKREEAQKRLENRPRLTSFQQSILNETLQLENNLDLLSPEEAPRRARQRSSSLQPALQPTKADPSQLSETEIESYQPAQISMGVLSVSERSRQLDRGEGLRPERAKSTGAAPNKGALSLKSDSTENPSGNNTRNFSHTRITLSTDGKINVESRR